MQVYVCDKCDERIPEGMQVTVEVKVEIPGRPAGYLSNEDWCPECAATLPVTMPHEEWGLRGRELHVVATGTKTYSARVLERQEAPFDSEAWIEGNPGLRGYR